MAGITERVRKGLGEPVQSMSQDVFKSLRQKSSASIILGKRTYSQLNNTKEEGERPSTQELGFGALRLGDKLRRTSPFIPDKPSTSMEQSGGENAMKVGPLARNIQRGNKDIRHTLRDNAYTNHQLLGNREGYYRQLHHDDRFSKPPVSSTVGHYTISKDYTGGEEMRRSRLLETYGRKCGTKRGSHVFVKQQVEETQVNKMDPTKVEPIIPAETEETQQQERVHNVLQKAQNTRFDIPEGRNLSNIDHLVAQSMDEREIKELKQQKRILRNRQAALESRDRKKQQTERLEDEKKQYGDFISDIEKELSQLSRRNEQLLLEKEEMIRSHTIETGELRKKVVVLTEHVQRLQNNFI